MGPTTSAAHAGRPEVTTAVERVTQGARPPRPTRDGRLRTLVAVGFLVAGCTTQSSATPVRSSADRDGLTVSAETTASGESIVVETVVENHRARSLYLVPTQCGRVTEVVLARTIFQPEGETWNGSLGALKSLVLEDQRMWQRPDPFAPRRPGDSSSGLPACERPKRPRELAAGAAIRERWELPLSSALGLDAVGSAGSVVRIEAVEARDPDRLELLDLLPTWTPDTGRAGRNVRVEIPASSVIDRSPLGGAQVPNLGQLYDRLLDDVTLRAWISAQPPDGWREGRLTLDGEGFRFKAVTTSFERAATATARADGTVVAEELPGEVDRTRFFPRVDGTLPPGIALIDEPDSYAVTDDLIIDGVELPTGRVVVGEYLADVDAIDLGSRPGVYPVRLTLARYPGQDFDRVAYASLVVSDAATVRWQPARVIAVDGGTTTFTSAEGASLLKIAAESGAGSESQDSAWDSLAAHDYLGTESLIDGSINLVMTSSGVGDGGYQVFVGYDSAGRPTRVVVDFLLVHLDWPRSGTATASTPR